MPDNQDSMQTFNMSKFTQTYSQSYIVHSHEPHINLNRQTPYGKQLHICNNSDLTGNQILCANCHADAESLTDHVRCWGLVKADVRVQHS